MKMKTKKLSAATKVLIGLAAGVVVGLLTQNYADFMASYIKPFGDIYMNALKMLIVPLVFSSLICGMSGMTDGKALGRIGVKGILLFICTTLVAAVFSLVIGNITHVGVGTGLSLEGVESMSVDVSSSPDLIKTIVNIIPTNPFAALSSGDMLQVIAFAMFVGFAITQVGPKAEIVLRFFEGFQSIMFKISGMVMVFTPYAVFAMMASTVSKNGPKVFLPLLSFILVCYLCFILFMVVVYSTMVIGLGKMNPISFLKITKDAALLAFSTCSSSATIPTSLKCSEELGISEPVRNFMIPLGSSIHLDGAIIYQGITTIFLANVMGGQLGLPQQITLILTVMLASLGTAGAAGSSMIILSAVLTSVGIPVSGIGLVMGVDRLVDMPRTSLNVLGDIVCALVVDKSEKKEGFKS